MKKLTTIVIFALAISSCGNIINEFAGRYILQQSEETPYGSSSQSESSEPSAPPVSLPPSTGGGGSGGGGGGYSYTLTLKANDGSSTQRVIRAAYGINVTLKNNFTSDYLDFKGWAASRAGVDSYADGAVFTITGNITLYARWTLTSGKETEYVNAHKNGNAITLAGVEWSPALGAAITAAIDTANMTLDLGGLSNLSSWTMNTIDNENARSKIANLILPDTVTSFGVEGANQGKYSSLRSVSGDGVTDINYGALRYCPLVSVNFPNAVYIRGDAFYNTAVTEISFPWAQTIKENAFFGCGKLRSVSLPLATRIEGSAFQQCLLLESVNIPLVTYIGNNAFATCRILNTLTLGLTPPSFDDNSIFGNVDTPDITINIPRDVLELYNEWKETYSWYINNKNLIWKLY